MSKQSTVDGPQSTVRSPRASINGLVLVGGKSSRMGYDKSLIEYHGKPQREYLVDLLNVFCEKVFVSCKSSHQIPDHLNPLPDQFEIESPLNGILTALTYNPSVAWLVVASDMPQINTEIIDHLLKNRDVDKVASCFLDSEGKNPEPLLSIWEPKAFPLVHAFFKQGRISPRDFLKTSDVKLIVPPSEKIHSNINTPEELQDFKARFSDRKE